MWLFLAIVNKNFYGSVCNSKILCNFAILKISNHEKNTIFCIMFNPFDNGVFPTTVVDAACSMV
jgi:hypothetical protein